MLTKTGAKLLDFGLAKMRAAEAVAGIWGMEGNALDKHSFEYAWMDTKWRQS